MRTRTRTTTNSQRSTAGPSSQPSAERSRPHAIAPLQFNASYSKSETHVKILLLNTTQFRIARISFESGKGRYMQQPQLGRSGGQVLNAIKQEPLTI